MPIFKTNSQPILEENAQLLWLFCNVYNKAIQDPLVMVMYCLVSDIADCYAFVEMSLQTLLLYSRNEVGELVWKEYFLL